MKSEVTVSEASNRFEIHVGEETAFLEFQRDGSKLVLTHTEVPRSIGSKGVGTSLVEAALHYARKESLKVVPSCPFVEAYMRRHKETLDLLSDS